MSNKESKPDEEMITVEAAMVMAKRAFWWSAEFTEIVYDNDIKKAWEYYIEGLK